MALQKELPALVVQQAAVDGDQGRVPQGTLHIKAGGGMTHTGPVLPRDDDGSHTFGQLRRVLRRGDVQFPEAEQTAVHLLLRLLAGEEAGRLTEEGAKMLDTTGKLEAGVPFCPPEGDAETGMVATNSVAQRTGNVSAGTSVFANVVLEKELSKVYPEIDLVTTPTGNLVAMVHCNNCTSDLNAWVGIFKEYSEAMGIQVDMNQLFGTLYRKAMEGDADCGGLLAYNYFSGEHITGFEEGRPLFVRTPESRFNLANFMRVNLFTSL